MFRKMCWYFSNSYKINKNCSIFQNIVCNIEIISNISWKKTEIYQTKPNHGRPTILFEMERFPNKYGHIVPPFEGWEKFHRCMYTMQILVMLRIVFPFFELCIEIWKIHLIFKYRWLWLAKGKRAKHTKWYYPHAVRTSNHCLR